MIDLEYVDMIEKDGLTESIFTQVMGGLFIKMFNNKQIECIKYCIVNNLDAELIVNPEYSYEQMYQITRAMEKSLDITPMLNPEFDVEQMIQIRYGLEDGIDASLYANKFMAAPLMEGIRLKLKEEKLYNNK